MVLADRIVLHIARACLDRLFAGRSRATGKLNPRALFFARWLVVGVPEAGLGHTLDGGCVRPALCFLHRNELAAL